MKSDDEKNFSYKAHVTDFGISRRILPQMANVLQTNSNDVGMPNYMAPELFNLKYPCSTKSDVFSYGCVIFECATGRQPFEETLLRFDIAHRVGHNDERPEILVEDKMEESLRALIESCWAENPNRRPNFEEILKRLIEYF